MTRPDLTKPGMARRALFPRRWLRSAAVLLVPVLFVGLLALERTGGSLADEPVDDATGIAARGFSGFGAFRQAVPAAVPAIPSQLVASMSSPAFVEAQVAAAVDQAARFDRFRPQCRRIFQLLQNRLQLAERLLMILERQGAPDEVIRRVEAAIAQLEQALERLAQFCRPPSR